MKLTKTERHQLAAKRLIKNLQSHGVANARTLEQKISDGGPFGQRIDPHVLTEVRNALVKEKRIISQRHLNVPWFTLPEINPKTLQARLDEQLPVYRELHSGNINMRLGQTLEIATYRALLNGPLEDFAGRFKNLESHDDSTMYAKEEPPQHIGKLSLPGEQRLDFLIRHPTAGYLGVECKNVRPWIYPRETELKEAIGKCLALDAVPVLIARRIPYVSFVVLAPCGVIMHQCYNQLLPSADEAIALKARDKTLLGYHDIRLGNAPDARLTKSFSETLPAIADDARAKYNEFKDLLDAFAFGKIPYDEFAARVRRRNGGFAEDFDRE